MNEEGPGWSLTDQVRRRWIFKEDPEGVSRKGGKPGVSTVFQKPVKTLFQEKELIKSKRSSKMVLKSILSGLSTWILIPFLQRKPYLEDQYVKTLLLKTALVEVGGWGTCTLPLSHPFGPQFETLWRIQVILWYRKLNSWGKMICSKSCYLVVGWSTLELSSSDF